MKSKIVIWTIVALILISSALALGISPAEKNIRVEPNATQTFTYIIINNEHRDFDLKISAVGELADFIKVPDYTIHLNSEEAEKSFEVNITLPSNLEPGERTGKIRLTETIPHVSVGENYVNVQLEVNSKITVIVPYPEKYITASIEVNATKQNEPINVSAFITNLGTRDIGNLKVKFGIVSDDKLITSTETDATSLLRKETKELSTQFELNLTPGDYSAVAKIFYDNNSVDLIKDFKVGDVFVEILDYTKYFIQGRLNKFDVDVTNEWNRKIKNAFALIFIDKFDAIKSITYDLNPYEKKTLVSYWDTAGVELGRYDSNVTVNYVNKTTTKQGEVYVVEPTQLEKTLGRPDYSLYTFVGIIFIILVNLVWLFFMRRKTPPEVEEKAAEVEGGIDNITNKNDQ